MPDQTPSSLSTPYGFTSVVDPNTLRFRRACKDEKEAFALCKRIVMDNRERNAKNAAILRKYNDEQPYSPTKMKAAGQGWRHNRSTGFMSSIIRRIIPPYKQVVDQARVLTMSKFNRQGPDYEQKQDDFRVEITRTVRLWPEWGSFLYQLVLDNVLFGWSSVNWSDEYDWRPQFCRTDDLLFPDGASQVAKEIPLFVRRQNFLIHELADKLVEPDISAARGWYIDNLVKAINNAQPENRVRQAEGDERKYEDAVRESTVGRSYSQGVKVIETYHLFIQEATGRVSHYLLDQRTGDPLMTILDRFENMEECLSLYSLEVGNGKLHGSKGAGRVLYNTHVAIEQSRNLIADNLYLSGLILLKGTPKGQDTAAITVTHPVCVLGEGFEVVDNQFKVNPEAFFQLDRHMSTLAELQVGAFLPSQVLDSGGKSRRKTAAEVNYVASVEQQIREGTLARFFMQFLLMMFQMQKRICSEENIRNAIQIIESEKMGMVRPVNAKMAQFIMSMSTDKQSVSQQITVIDESKFLNKDAVECCYNLLKKGLSPEEIYELAVTPPFEYSQDIAAQNAQNIELVISRYQNNPKVNQQKLMRRDISSKLGSTIADELIIPEEDNTLASEGTRMQLLELEPLMQGDKVPVSPRDDDVVHMGVIMQKSKDFVKTLTPEAMTPMTLKIAENLLGHFDDHVKGALNKKMSKDQLMPFAQFSDQIHAIINQIKPVLGQKPQNAPPALPPGVSPAVGGASDLSRGKTRSMHAAEAQVTAPPTLPSTPTTNKPLSSGPKSLTPPLTQVR